jgi:nicotinamide phosphoribosyltransferase
MISDSYKYSHFKQYPTNMNYMFDYMESRGGTYPATVFFGLQYMLKEYFSAPITEAEVIEAYEYSTFHGIPFDKEGWMYIVNELKGMLPIRIKAVKEGTLVPVKNALVTIESTDETVPWVVGWFETFIMKVWYPTTIATKSYFVKQMLKEFSDKTGCGFVDFQYHNFGDRGSSTVEAASIGGAAHLTQFQGTDNFHALKLVKDYYNTKEVVGFSIPATEHSSVTSWGRDNEYTMIMNYIENHKDNAIIACVMDSYNIYNAVEEVTKGDFKMKIESDEYPIFVIRPDSGDPVSVIGDIITITEKNEVSYTINDKGFKVWNKYRIIWGDGITPETIKDILTFVTDKGYSSDNMAFGSGGDLMQNVNRDTQKFAVKCSAIRTTDGQLIDVFKDPITDKGKASKKGIIELYKNGEGFFTDVRSRAWEDKTRAVLEVVFENGVIVREQTFEDIKMCSEV